jgi:hypothetical protein
LLAVPAVLVEAVVALPEVRLVGLAVVDLPEPVVDLLEVVEALVLVVNLVEQG